MLVSAAHYNTFEDGLWQTGVRLQQMLLFMIECELELKERKRGNGRGNRAMSKSKTYGLAWMSASGPAELKVGN